MIRNRGSWNNLRITGHISCTARIDSIELRCEFFLVIPGCAGFFGTVDLTWPKHLSGNLFITVLAQFKHLCEQELEAVATVWTPIIIETVPEAHDQGLTAFSVTRNGLTVDPRLRQGRCWTKRNRRRSQYRTDPVWQMLDYEYHEWMDRYACHGIGAPRWYWTQRYHDLYHWKMVITACRCLPVPAVARQKLG